MPWSKKTNSTGQGHWRVLPPPAPGAKRYKIDPAFLRSLSAQRQGQGGDEFKTAIIQLIEAAQADGRKLGSLELGESLQRIFGIHAYDRFRSEHGGGKLGKALKALGFRTEPTKSGFTVDFY